MALAHSSGGVLGLTSLYMTKMISDKTHTAVLLPKNINSRAAAKNDDSALY